MVPSSCLYVTPEGSVGPLTSGTLYGCAFLFLQKGPVPVTGHVRQKQPWHTGSAHLPLTLPLSQSPRTS